MTGATDAVRRNWLGPNHAFGLTDISLRDYFFASWIDGGGLAGGIAPTGSVRWGSE
jgi:hypothetical protein